MPTSWPRWWSAPAIVTGQEQDTLRVASAMEQMTVSSREVGQHRGPGRRRGGLGLNLAQHGREVVVQTGSPSASWRTRWWRRCRR